MPIDFPNNPTTGLTYSYGGQLWEYNGVGWDKVIIADLAYDSDALYGISGYIYASSLATGLLYGGIISINSGNSAAFDITAGKGQIHTSGSTFTAVPNPTLQFVTWPAQTGITLQYLATSDTTWIYIDGTGTVQQRTEYYTDTQLEETIIIGQLVHPSRTFINLARTNPNVAYATDKQYEQFIRSFGPIKVSGHTIQPNGANLKLNRTSGTAFSLGRNWINDTDNPSVVSDGAYTDCIFYRYYRGATAGTFITVPNQTAIDPTKYDNGTGTLATVPGGKYTIQRLFYYPNTPSLLGVYYGRAEYTSLADAAANINFENFTEIENTRTNAIFAGYLLVKSGTTDLTNTSDALILQAGNFRSTTSGGGSVSLTLDDLTDVIITSPQNYQVLTYVDGVTGWENKSVSTLPLVSSIRGLTGAVGITNGSGIGLGVSGQTMTFSNTGVLSIDGGTGDITNVARTNVANTFTSLQSFSSGISAAGATFATDLSVNSVLVGRGAGSIASNTVLGVAAFTSNISGTSNLAVGQQSLQSNTGGSSNTAIGRRALNALTVGSSNTSVGTSSLLAFNGNNTVSIGANSATSIVGGTGNVYVGANVSGTNAATREIVIGESAVGLGSNTTAIGRTDQISATIYGLLNAPGGISAAGATFTGNISAPNIVNSVRGLTGAVGITNGSGIGLSVSGQTMTFSNTGVLSIDGGTGAITNVARTNVDNIFSASQTISTSNAALSIVDSSSFNEVSFQGEFNRLYFYNDLSSGEVFFQPTIATASTITVSLPDYTTTLAGLAGTQTFTGINTFNALTNFPGGISAAGATFSSLVRFNAGISAAGGTFGGNLRLQNGEFLQNTTNGRMDFMPAPGGSTHYGLYVDMTSWGFGPALGTIRSSDGALNTGGQIRWDVPLVMGNDVNFSFGANQQNLFRLSTTGNDTVQFSTTVTTGTNSGALALVDAVGLGAANRSPGVTHSNPNLYVYRAGSARANDFMRFEHDGNNGRIVSGGTSGISIEPGSGILGISGGVSGGYGLNANSFGLTSGFDIIPASWDSITAPMGAPGTVANRLYLAAISIPSRCTVKTFATQQGTSSAGNTGNIFLGLYNTNIHGLPQNLVAQSSSQSLTTTNFAVIRASNINYTANPGNYWLAICFSASGLSGGIGRPGTPMKFITATSSSPIGQSMNWGLYVTQSGFTLSTSLSGATFTAITTNTDFPAIFYTAEGL